MWAAVGLCFPRAVSGKSLFGGVLSGWHVEGMGRGDLVLRRVGWRRGRFLEGVWKRAFFFFFFFVSWVDLDAGRGQRDVRKGGGYDSMVLEVKKWGWRK